jgi:glyceraldehyde 3-phosphate dehydrogenase
MKVAINGFGRIGRQVFKIGLEKGVDFVAINDLVDTKTLVYLLKYDSVYGVYKKKVEEGEGFLKIGGRKIKILSERDPEKLPWKAMGVDIVVESTGFFTDREGASKHLKAGAKRVIISAPAKSPDKTVVLGVNDSELKKTDRIISNASCTTNCLAPVVKVLNDKFGIRKGFMTTVHAYTSTQEVVDCPNKKLRRGRAAGLNIIPTTTGASEAIEEVLPELKGKFNGLSMRVPIACGSIVDFVAELERATTKEEVNEEFKKQAKGKLKGILDYTEEEIVSSDIIENPFSSVVDGLSTQVMDNCVKILAWYDNEYGYSCRVVDLLKTLK